MQGQSYVTVVLTAKIGGAGDDEACVTTIIEVNI
jgi:hypothetical protein